MNDIFVVKFCLILKFIIILKNTLLQSLIIRDTVRECLDKEPSDRSDADVDALLDFVKHLAAFTHHTQSLQRALCAALRYAVVEPPGAVVLNEGEQLDAWCVVINGYVETLTTDSSNNSGGGGLHPIGSKPSSIITQQLHVGDGFGVEPTMEKQYQRGVMRTGCIDCQFVCVPQAEYYRIWNEGAKNTQTHCNADGEPVMVTEYRSVLGRAHWAHVVIRVSQILRHIPLSMGSGLDEITHKPLI